MIKTSRNLITIVLVLGMLFTIFTGCNTKGSSIKVGSKEFTEQLLLGQITILALEDAGYKVDDKTGIAGSDKGRSALINEEIDINWEYTGTAWISLLQNEIPIKDPQECYEQVKAADKMNGIEWLNYAPFNNTYTVMMRKSQAQELGIKTLNELSHHINVNPNHLRFAVDHEFTARPDGLSGLEENYGFKVIDSNLLVMDNGIIYRSLKEEQVDIGMGFATDARIKAYDLINLEDDLSFFPAYNPAPNLRVDFAEENPEIVEILNQISARLDNDTIGRLNYLVDIEQMVPKTVAKEWLLEEGLIKQ